MGKDEARDPFTMRSEIYLLCMVRCLMLLCAERCCHQQAGTVRLVMGGFRNGGPLQATDIREALL
jgi:hypothetical protein